MLRETAKPTDEREGLGFQVGLLDVARLASGERVDRKRNVSAIIARG
jgi:hypothetical protein